MAGVDTVFGRSPIPNDHAYYPENLGLSVAEIWRSNQVPIAELLQISGWASYKPYPTVFSKRSDCAQGYADYEELVDELSSREGATKGDQITFLKGICMTKILL